MFEQEASEDFQVSYASWMIMYFFCLIPKFLINEFRVENLGLPVSL